MNGRWRLHEPRIERVTLDRMGAKYLRNASRLMPANRAIKASEWLVMS